MKKFTLSLLSILLISLLPSINVHAQGQDSSISKSKALVLYNTIVHMDSVYFNAYNSCDMATQAAIYADSIEFYHDGSGLETSKKDLLKAIKENICGKVTRQLVNGSIEVYPFPILAL